MSCSLPAFVCVLSVGNISGVAMFAFVFITKHHAALCYREVTDSVAMPIVLSLKVVFVQMQVYVYACVCEWSKQCIDISNRVFCYDAS